MSRTARLLHTDSVADCAPHTAWGLLWTVTPTMGRLRPSRPLAHSRWRRDARGRQRQAPARHADAAQACMRTLRRGCFVRYPCLCITIDARVVSFLVKCAPREGQVAWMAGIPVLLCDSTVVVYTKLAMHSFVGFRGNALAGWNLVLFFGLYLGCCFFSFTIQWLRTSC